MILSKRDLADLRASGALTETQAPKRSKYGAVKTEVDGIRFDSKKEAKRYGELKVMVGAGQVRWFTMQVPFRLDGGTIYRADFLVVWADGSVAVEDCKGFLTASYRIKRREVEHKFGFTIREI